MNKKTFEIITEPKVGGRYTFLTKGKNGKEALQNLLDRSSDFNQILGSRESNNMTIKIIHMKK